MLEFTIHHRINMFVLDGHFVQLGESRLKIKVAKEAFHLLLVSQGIVNLFLEGQVSAAADI